MASGELLLLRWADDDDDTGQDALHSGSRWTVGYMTDAGRTLRARYFEFATIEDGGTDEYRLETLDLEMASRFTLGCGLYGELSAGARWAQLEDEEDGHRWNDTLGMVLGAEVRADMPFNLTMYSGVRVSHQFGHEVNDGNQNSEFNILELRAGTECRRNNLFLRGGYETQSVGQAHGYVLPLMELEFPGVELAYSTTGEILCHDHEERSLPNRRQKLSAGTCETRSPSANWLRN